MLVVVSFDSCRIVLLSVGLLLTGDDVSRLF